MTFQEQLEKCKKEEVRLIAEYLQSRGDMAEKLENPKKSLDEMMSYLLGEAYERAKEGWTMIEHETVYEWAVHYYDEENIVIKPSVGRMATKKTSNNTNVQKPISQKKKPKVEQDVYQMNLFEE